MAQTTVQKTYGEAESGCWFDNHRGIYMGEEIIKLAKGHGFETDGEGHVGRWADYEHYLELWDEAEQHMAQFAAPGYAFGYSEGFGDWGLWPIEED